MTGSRPPRPIRTSYPPRATCTSENCDFLIAGVGAFSVRTVKIPEGIFLRGAYLPSRVVSAFGMNPMMVGHTA
jgi:hypothetical protein